MVHRFADIISCCLLYKRASQKCRLFLVKTCVRRRLFMRRRHATKPAAAAGGANKKALSISFSPYVLETRRDAVVGRIKGDIFEWDPANNAIFSAHCCCTLKQGLVLASLIEKKERRRLQLFFFPIPSFLIYLSHLVFFFAIHPRADRRRRYFFFFCAVTFPFFSPVLNPQ